MFLGLELFGAKSYKVAALYWSMNIPGQVAMRAGLVKAYEAINKEALATGAPTVELLEYVAGDGEQGIENQINQMHDAVAKSVDLIIVQPTDNAALVEPLKAANIAKIPVVAYDQYIIEGKIDSYVTSDNYMAGYLNGEYIASKFKDEYEIKLILVDYPHVSSTVERVDGFLDALRDTHQAYKILASYKAVEPIGGKQAGADILRDFPRKGSVDAVFTVNDGGGLSVVKALKDAKRDEIIVATIDGDPVSIENIRDKTLTKIDSAQFCGPIGEESMKIAYKLLMGKEIPTKVLIPVFPVTEETLDMYPGWLGPIPDTFKKPWQAKNEFWNNTIKQIR